MATVRNASAGIWMLNEVNDETRGPIVVGRLVFTATANSSCVVVDLNDNPIVTLRSTANQTVNLRMDRKVNGIKVSAIVGANALLTVIEKAGTAG